MEIYDLKRISSEIGQANAQLRDIKKIAERGARNDGDSLIQVRPREFGSEAEIQRMAKEHADRAMRRTTVPKEEFSFCRAALGQITGRWDEVAPYEKEVFAEGRRRMGINVNEKTISWASGSAGGYWVPEEFLPEEWYMCFTAALVARKAGIKILPLKSAPALIPRTSAHGTAYWVAQNSTITESSPTPNQLSLTPKWCCARTQVSTFLAEASTGAAESLVRDEIARRIALAVDAAVLDGHGTSGQPTGLMRTSSINTVALGTDGGPFVPTTAFSMLYSLEADNVPMDGVSWIYHPRTWNSFRQSVVGADTWNYLLWQNQSGSIANATRYELLGYPVYTTTQMPVDGTKGNGTDLASVLLVNWKECILGEWGGLEIKATDVGGNAWAQNAIEFRAVYACDVGVRDANVVCLCSDSTT